METREEAKNDLLILNKRQRFIIFAFFLSSNNSDAMMHLKCYNQHNRKYYIQLIIPSLIIFLLHVNLSHQAVAVAEKNEEKITSDLITWIKSKGGKINSKLEISSKKTTTSNISIIAAKDIPSQALLFKIPHSIILSGGVPKIGDKVSFITDNESTSEVLEYGTVIAAHDDKYDIKLDDEDNEVEYDVLSKYVSKYTGRGMECDTVKNLIQEKELGGESEYAPYINYLFSRDVTLPSSWSDEGKELFSNILGEYLPPSLPFIWNYTRICKGTDDNNKAGWIQVQYSKDDLLIPIYDMIPHANGHHTNADVAKFHYKTDVVIRASRNIKQGEQIYISKNLCKECYLEDDYGTAECKLIFLFVSF